MTLQKKKYRTCIGVVHSILNTLQDNPEGLKKSGIARICNLSHEATAEKLELMLESKLIYKKDTCDRIKLDGTKRVVETFFYLTFLGKETLGKLNEFENFCISNVGISVMINS